VQYLLNASETIDSMDELMQMAVIDLIRADAKLESPNRVSQNRVVAVLRALLIQPPLIGKVDPSRVQLAECP